MSLADPFSRWAVFDCWEQKIVTPWHVMPANGNSRSVA
jgi:hypothetical protein